MGREQENIVTMGVRFVPAVEHSSEDQFNQGEEITENNANRSKKIPQTKSRLNIFVEILNNFFITHWETMQKSVCPKYLIKFDKLQTKNMIF